MKVIPPSSEKFVGIWIRVSTDDQARSDSPAVHEKRARMYAELKGWRVREVYHLEGVSGKAVAEHPEAKRMLADVRAGRISALIFSKLARLARNTKELLDFSEQFQKCGADLVSLQENIDTTSPAGRLFYTMIAAMAQWEREEIGARIAASIPIRAKLGKPIGRKPPYGYHRVEGKVVPHPTEAPVRALMYALYIEHRRLKTIARMLNDQGYRTSSGQEFTDSTIKRLIRDPSAKGELLVNHTFNDPERPGFVKRKPKSEWIIQPVEAIIAPELWERANAILEHRNTSWGKVARRPVHLFAGLTYCTCGQKMYVPSRNPRYMCYRCQNRIPTKDLETIYHEQLKGFLFSDRRIAEQLEATDKLIIEKAEYLLSLERKRENVVREMEKTYRLYQEEQISPGGFGTRYRPLEARLVEIDDSFPREQASLDVMRVNRLSSGEIVAEARNLHSRWSQLPQDQKRIVVEAITEKIVVGNDSVEIRLHHVPIPGDDGGRSGPSDPNSETNSNSSPSSRKATTLAIQPLLRDGDERDVNAAKSAARCDEWGCVATDAGGKKIALALRPGALADDCERANVLISTIPLRQPCATPKRVIDRFNVLDEGAMALWFLGDGVRSVSVAQTRGQRPWSMRQHDPPGARENVR